MANGGPYNHTRAPSDSISRFGPSSSSTQLDYYYQPSFEQRGRTPSADHMANDFGQLSVMEPGRRESFPVCAVLFLSPVGLIVD